MTAAHNRCMGLGGPVFLKPINIDSLLRGLRWYLN
jgi:hypothetical protein